MITQCHNKFTHNTAYYGGAVASANSIDTFSGNHFINNTALNTGGATSIQVGNLNISGRFENNSALISGGAILGHSSSIIISCSTFHVNSADEGTWSNNFDLY